MEDPPQKVHEKLLQDLRNIYHELDRIAAIREGDAALVKAGKVLLRTGIIVFIILLSPFVLIGLIMAFLAAL
jgi:hypothetical protein